MAKFTKGKWVLVATYPPQGYPDSFWRYVSGRIFQVLDINDETDEIQVIDSDTYGNKTIWLPAESLILTTAPRQIYRNQKMEEYNRCMKHQASIRNKYMREVFSEAPRSISKIETHFEPDEKEDESNALDLYFDHLYR